MPDPTEVNGFLTVRRACVAALALVALGAAGCGGGGLDVAAEPDPPVGAPLLPDLMPKPQLNVVTKRVKGRWRIFFNTTLVNVGAGDFRLRATRSLPGGWQIEQDIPYSEDGAEQIRIRGARLAWGGDGHEHWHIARIASVHLVRLDSAGKPVEGGRSLVDSKIGFCFYDHTHELPRGSSDQRFTASGCGEREDTRVGMGLSPGWNDVYLQTLPGQSIDVTGLPEGTYRLFTDVDEQGWFREASRSNNRTWIDLELRQTPLGLAAPTVATGPIPA